jgi:hypothetical protein
MHLHQDYFPHRDLLHDLLSWIVSTVGSFVAKVTIIWLLWDLSPHNFLTFHNKPSWHFLFSPMCSLRRFPITSLHGSCNWVHKMTVADAPGWALQCLYTQRMMGLMVRNYALRRVGSGAKIYRPSFIKISSSIQQLERATHRNIDSTGLA